MFKMGVKIAAVLLMFVSGGFILLDRAATNRLADGVRFRVHSPLPRDALDQGAAPLVLLLGGSEGGYWGTNTVEVQDLRQRGAYVVELAYFGVPDVPKNLSGISLDQFGPIFTKLLAIPGASNACFAIIGVSKGAELALNLGARYPEIRSVVAITPAHVSFQASSLTPFAHSSWRFKGEDVPYVAFPKFLMATLDGVLSGENYTAMHLEALQAGQAVISAAEIQVERTNGPVLLLSGIQDQMWPSTLMATRLNARLVAKGFANAFRHIDYDVDHDILGHPRAWPNVIEFLGAEVFAPAACDFSQD